MQSDQFDNEGRRDGRNSQNHDFNGHAAGKPRQRFTRGGSAYAVGSSRMGDTTKTSYGNRSNNGEGRGSYGQRREGNAFGAPRSNGYRDRSDYRGNREGGYSRQPYNREGGYNRNGNGYSRSGYGRNEGNETGSYGNNGYRSRSYGEGEERRTFTPREGGNGYRPQGCRPGSFGGGRPQGGRNFNGGPRSKYSEKKRIIYHKENFDPDAPIRLNKFLANAGVCSRRDADKYIEAGIVTVNGEVVTTLGRKVLRTDDVKFHDSPIRPEKKLYILLNKPKGYVTTNDDPENRKTVMDIVKGAFPERVYPVGRLDRNTTGVLLLTNDGELAAKLTHPKYLKRKIYHVTLDHNVTAADMRQIAEGLNLEDGEIKADAIEYASPTDKKEVGIEIHSGRNRIVRRIFESLGYKVVKLDRVYFAGLTKKNVRRGDWRYLNEKEVNLLKMGSFE